MEVHFGLSIRWRVKGRGGILWKAERAPGDMGFSWEVGSALAFGKIEKLPTLSKVLFQSRINLFLPTTLWGEPSKDDCAPERNKKPNVTQ